MCLMIGSCFVPMLCAVCDVDLLLFSFDLFKSCAKSISDLSSAQLQK